MEDHQEVMVKLLVAVAWADGNLENVESSMLEGLLWAFGAEEEEEEEILEYAQEKRTLEDDIPLDELSDEDRELLLAHAALLTHADGDQSADEKALLDKLVDLLDIDDDKAAEIIANAAVRAKKK